MEKQKTIRDVAQLAGVSVATASRVLSDSGYPVRPHLRQRVLDAAEKLEYTPNMIAQSLRRDTRRDIALVIPNLSNPFYLQALLGVGEGLSDGNCNLILCNTMHDPERERQYLKQLYERQVQGVILSSVEDSNLQTVEKYAAKGMKFVLLDQMSGSLECPGIQFDSRAGARMAAEHLIGLGHTKIAFASTPLVRFTRTEIYKGYCEAMMTAGLDCPESLLFTCAISKIGRSSDYELNVGRKIAKAFLDKDCPATAIICINDMIAIGLIQALTQHGLRVPEDVSVIGFDNIPIAGAFVPALTTVHYPAQEVGRLAAIMLMDSMQNDAKPAAITMNLPPKLIVRESTAAPRSKIAQKNPPFDF